MPRRGACCLAGTARSTGGGAWLAAGRARATVAAVGAALRTGDSATIEGAAWKLSSLTRINLLQALIELRPTDLDTATRLLGEIATLDGEAVLDQLEAARHAAGERRIDGDMFDDMLAAHARRLGERLAAVFAATPAGRTALAQALQNSARRNRGPAAECQDALLRSYGAAIDAALEQSRGSILSGLTTLKQEPGNQALATMLATTLDHWSNLRRPVQLHEAARGLDDPASAELFEKVRSLLVTLSNEHRAFDVALRLARSLMRSFANVPMHRAALERELPVLIGNAVAERAGELRDEAVARGLAFAKEIEGGALDTGRGLAGLIRTLVVEVAELDNPDAVRTVFVLVRDIGLQMHNELHAIRAAYLLTVWLSEQRPPADVAARLEGDLKHFGVQAQVATREAGSPASREAPASPAPSGFGRAARAPGDEDGARSRSGSAPGSAQAKPRKRWIPQTVRRREKESPRGHPVLNGFLILLAIGFTASNLLRSRRPPVVQPSPHATTPTARPIAARTPETARRDRLEGILRQMERDRALPPSGLSSPTPRPIIPGQPMNPLADTAGTIAEDD